MRDLSFLQSPAVHIEIGIKVWRLATAKGVVEFAVDRAPDGRLTPVGRQKLTTELAQAVDRRHWQLKPRAICALNAAGVLLRKVTMPNVPPTEFQEVLQLQIEKEFPLSPADLAWGWLELSSADARREILLVALRREVVEDYSALLMSAGLQPEFTLAAWVRHFVCPPVKGPYSILEASDGWGELIAFENNAPSVLRVFPNGQLSANAVQQSAVGPVLFVAGNSAALPELINELSRRTDCRRLVAAGETGESTALAGLKKAGAEKRPLLELRVQPKAAKASWGAPLREYRQPLIRLGILLGGLLLLPYLEALLFKPLVDYKLNKFQKQKMQFDSVVSPEMNFFLYLKQNQPPYLDTLCVLAKNSPPGTHIDSISLDQIGQISVKCSVQNAQQMMDFRGKLIDSGYFATITVEEQSPERGQPKLNVRMSLRWKPTGRPTIKLDPAPATADAANPAGASPKM